MVLIFQGVKHFDRSELEQLCTRKTLRNHPRVINDAESHSTVQARNFFLDGVSSVSSSSFQESALCIRAQIALASISLEERDVEGCLNRLALTNKCIQEKHKKLGCGPPSPAVYVDYA
jgi:hypothetical protein